MYNNDVAQKSDMERKFPDKTEPPFWTYQLCESRCSKCGHIIEPGEAIYYMPELTLTYCETCGKIKDRKPERVNQLGLFSNIPDVLTVDNSPFPLI